MHRVEIPDDVVRRVLSRQGCLHAHANVPASETALVVVDMQNYFLAPGQQGETPAARGIVSNVNRVASELRRAGGSVVWLTTIADPEAVTGWSHFHAVLNTPERDATRREALARGAFGAALWPALDVRPSDTIVEKTRYSAFAPGASPLESFLRTSGTTAVLVAGTATNTCCDSTARDAMLRDFRTTMISDANATDNDAEHNAALVNFYLTFGDVASSDDVVTRLRQQ